MVNLFTYLDIAAYMLRAEKRIDEDHKVNAPVRSHNHVAFRRRPWWQIMLITMFVAQFILYVYTTFDATTVSETAVQLRASLQQRRAKMAKERNTKLETTFERRSENTAKRRRRSRIVKLAAKTAVR